MKIALFTETYPPDINGVATHVKSLKDGLESKGHTVLVTTISQSVKRHILKNDVLYCPGKKFKRLCNQGVTYPLSIKRYNYIKNFNPDIIHIHTEFTMGMLGVYCSKRLNIPLVQTMHTMYDEYMYYLIPKPFIPIAKKTTHKYAKFIANRATAMTGPSKKVQEYYKKCGVNKNISVIPNPVDLEKFNINNLDMHSISKLKQKYNITENHIVICFCGRIAKEKNLDVLLHNFHKTLNKKDNLKLLMFGDGPYRPDLEKLSLQLNLDDFITFIGNIENSELPSYYAICDMYITTSLSDTNSISMLEAMAMGLPVLHIYDPLNEGQIINGVNGYIFYNETQMYNKILEYKNKSLEQKAEFKKSVIQSVQKSGKSNLASYLLEVYNATYIHKK